MQTPITSCHLIPTWHEWNANADDVMMMCSHYMQTLVTSDYTCMMHTCTQALSKTGMSKYLSGLAYMQANPNLVKIATSHFQVLNA